MKLAQDFGVSALIAVLIVIGGFTTIIIGLLTKQIDAGYVMVVVASWVSSAATAYLTVKAVKTSKGKENNQ